LYGAFACALAPVCRTKDYQFTKRICGKWHTTAAGLLAVADASTKNIINN